MGSIVANCRTIRTRTLHACKHMTNPARSIPFHLPAHKAGPHQKRSGAPSACGSGDVPSRRTTKSPPNTHPQPSSTTTSTTSSPISSSSCPHNINNGHTLGPNPCVYLLPVVQLTRPAHPHEALIIAAAPACLGPSPSGADPLAPLRRLARIAPAASVVEVPEGRGKLALAVRWVQVGVE